ncbi:MAG: STAS domain-containing protein [Thermoleophilaceae bacterium]
MTLPPAEAGATGSPDGLLTVRTEQHNDHRVIVVSGEIDMSTAPLLDQEVLRAEADGPRPIVVDLRQVTFMDLRGLQLLLTASARSRADAKRLSVVRGPRAVQRLFELTGTEALVPFVDR